MAQVNFFRKCSDLPVSYRITDCYLGYILVVFTDKGVCLIEIGDDPEVLFDRVKIYFKDNNVTRLENDSHRLIQAVIKKINFPRRKINIPLDMRGTDFQKFVWKNLQGIPCGSTISYSELAVKIGHPNAARAVANACASNRIAIIIPCHRVMRKDGSLGGYRWGIDKKRLLLDKEHE